MDLKRLKLSSSLVALGSLFQSDGAAAAEALSPSVFFVFVDGDTNKSSEFERRPYVEKFLTLMRLQKTTTKRKTNWSNKVRLTVLEHSMRTQLSQQWKLLRPTEEYRENGGGRMIII